MDQPALQSEQLLLLGWPDNDDNIHFPAGQFIHNVAPAREYVPAEQSIQLTEDVCAVKLESMAFPAGQFIHNVAPAREYVPAEQSIQLAEDVCAVKLESMAFPAEQAVHDVCGPAVDQLPAIHC